MTNEDSYQRGPRPVPRDRNRRKKGKLPKPVVRIGGSLLVFTAVLLLIIFSARACARSGEEGAYQNYVADVQQIVAASDEIGKQLTTLMVSPGDISRSEVQARLEGFVSQCDSLEQQAQQLSAPKSMLSGTAQQIFALVMHFRATGMNQLKTYLLSALELEDTSGAAIAPAVVGATTTTVASATVSAIGSTEQIMNSLRFLTTSDFMYKEVFEVEVAKLLAERAINGVTVPSSQFINDPELASTSKVNKIVAAMKTTGNLQAVHGVALKAVMEMPDSKQIAQGSTYDLTQSAGLSFVVTVENQGTMDEIGVPVTIELVSKSTKQQSVTGKIATLKAKGTETITVAGLNATAYGETATLKITVGPVKGERNWDNNTLTATVIFRL
jgi:type IV pilus biogenesis protein CpaD/CtpE